MKNKISYIIPCYFNEGNIPVTTKKLIDIEKDFDDQFNFEYVFVDDGSEDNTLNELIKFRDKHLDKVKIVKLTGNFGTFNAILAGMNHTTGDCSVILSADLQDPPELIPKMVKHWLGGIKLVIANRDSREDSFIQKIISNLFHNLIRKFAIKNIPKGGFDLILFDKKISQQIIKMNQKNTHLIYLISTLKYDYVSIPYTRKKREIGKSKWTFSKKIKLFIDTFVSFSFLPLRLISIGGIILGGGAITYAVFIIVNKIQGNIQMSGWSATMVTLLMVSSFQMIATGILGEYLWRTLDASRNRPNYIIDKIY